MSKKKAEPAELVLLGGFAVFVLAFVWDIRGLPLDGKLLSYLVAPFALGLIGFRTVAALRPRKAGPGREVEYFPEPEEPSSEEELTLEEREGKRAAQRCFLLTIGMSVFLFAAIALVGFYWGSGLTLLAWFACFKRITRGTLLTTVLTPLLLYLAFERLLEMGLPKGALFTWLGN